MSSPQEHCHDAASGTDTSAPEGNTPDKALVRPADTAVASSCSVNVHLDYIVTFRGTAKRVSSTKRDQTVDFCHQDRENFDPIPQSRMSFTCTVDSDGDQLRLDIDASAGAIPVPPCDSRQRPEPANKTENDVRATRTAALNAMFGAWKDLPDTPKDGLQYQIETRAEWP